MAEVFPVAPAGWAAAYAVHEQAFSRRAADFLSRGSFQSLAATPNALLLGLGEGKGHALLGYILARQAGGEAEILSLGVRPEARHQGFGKKLLAAAVSAVRAKGAEKVFLEADPANAAAVKVYEATGFTPCGVRKGYYRHKNGEIADALTMVLPLVN